MNFYRFLGNSLKCLGVKFQRFYFFFHYFKFKISSILSLSNPITILPSISKTGTPIWPLLSIISFWAFSSDETSILSNAIPFSVKYALALLHHGQVGVEYTLTIRINYITQKFNTIWIILKVARLLR